MSNKRSEQKSYVVPFTRHGERDCQNNLEEVIGRAKLLRLEGFEEVIWEESTWTIVEGRLTKLSARNVRKVKLNFHYSPKLGSQPIPMGWSDLVKALLILRFHSRNQGLENQRYFITAGSYIAHEMVRNYLTVFQLTPEYLNRACNLISKHYSECTAYNLHKLVIEFAAHCDANKLCNVFLDYRYSQMKRPTNAGGMSGQRLDDPQVLQTRSDKLVDPEVFKVLGELYQKLPKDHKYRPQLLVLILLACLGRRLSEISLLPNQRVSRDDEGRAYIEYFPRKSSKGDVFTPYRHLFLPTEVVDIVESVIIELGQLCSKARDTAAEMLRAEGPDLRFLSQLSETQRIYKKDLEPLALTTGIFDQKSWLTKNGYRFADEETLASRKPVYYTLKKGLIAYCENYFKPCLIKPIHIDQQGKKYYLKDLLIVKHVGKRSCEVAHWVATQLTHSMIDKLLDYLPDLAQEYTSTAVEVNFTSHSFRHTLNTLLDEGGLPDLLQTRWFGRMNSEDTKAYQHTSREKQTLLLREAIRTGKVGGLLVNQIQSLPVSLQEAVLNARVQAVHDLGTGFCVHNFSQTPCHRHLQCTAECEEYVWIKGDKEERVKELKRQYAITRIARDTAERTAQSSKPRKSIDWLAHNDKKLRTLTQQLTDNGIDLFDPYEYLDSLGEPYG